jgi:hypothetical protein
MTKAVNLVRLLTIMLFLAMLGTVYVYLAPLVDLTTTSGELTLDKNYFFYYAAGGFLVINIFLWFLMKLLVPVMQRFSELTQAWFNLIAPVINFYITVIIAFIGIINNPSHASAQNFNFLNYVGPVILLFWLLIFFYLLKFKTSEEE